MIENFKFYENPTHCLRSGQVLEITHNSINNFGVKSTLGTKIWALTPENLKPSTSLNSFKQDIKQWKPKKLSLLTV